MQTVRVGVIGVGRLGRAHARVYSELAGVELVGVTDRVEQQGREVAQACHTQFFLDLEGLCRQVDGVSVTVPTSGHHAVGLAALEAGCHLLVEKPISVTLAEADALVNEAYNRQRILQVGHIERFNGAMRALEQIPIRPRFIESHRLAPFSPRGTDVAVVLDLMIHDIDLIRHLVQSPIEQIDATGVAVISEWEDIANARLRFANGCVANVTASRISLKKMRKMRIFQTNSYISLDFLQGQTEIYRLVEADRSHAVSQAAIEMVFSPEVDSLAVGKKILYERPVVFPKEPLKLELQAFIDSIRSGGPPPVTGEDGREALQIGLHILSLIRSQRRSAPSAWSVGK